MSFLSDLVVAKVKELGTAKSSEFFDVGEALVRQWETGTKPVSLAAVDKVFSSAGKALSEPSWQGKKVMLMLPWYKTTHPLTSFCLLALLDKAKMGAAMEFGDALVAHARNKLLDTLVSSGIEYGFFADDDMIFPCGNAGWFNNYTGMALPEAFAGKHTLEQLMSRNKTLVSGLYFQRKEKGRAVYLEALMPTEAGESENRFALSAPVDLCKEVTWAGTGCMLIHRSVPLEMREKMPWLAPQTAGESWHYFSSASDALIKHLPSLEARLSDALTAFSSDGNGENLEKEARGVQSLLKTAIFSATKADRLNDGEDAVFGRRAASLGHKTFVDFSIVCGHIGGKIFSGK